MTERNRRAVRLIVSLALMVAVAGAAGVVRAQAPAPAEPKLGTSNSTELGLVVTTGNSRATSVGFRNVYLYRWTNRELGWETGWLRAASRDGDRFAVVRGTAFDVVDPGTAVDSSRLFSKLRYQRQLSARHDWFSNFDAVRDEPANINRQFVLAAGLGTTWVKSDRLTFRTAYGISYTDEDLVIEGGNRFAGYRLFYGLKSPVTPSTTIESELTADGSFDTGDDIRTDWLNGVNVALNSRMALKSSLRVLFRNLPALETLDLLTPGGVPVGLVDVPKQNVDLGFTTSLVITF